jgi:flavin reductase (DIM6/NTAB) family NADH-FMN oxidoreductase RutF
MHAMVASSFMVGVSLDPCLMAIAIQKTSESWPHVRQAGILGMSVFGEGQGSLVHQLSSKDRARRFDGIAVETDELGAVYVEGAAMWFQTRIHDEAEAGDHWMVLLEVLRSGTADATEPLLWHKSKIRRIVD